ncbi:hypothetical protein LH935_21560 [Gordonia polyisoprenivorans]|uniref:hypothetical protein n=1 Tax=Gordonia polyisoprenivorans TaxID=84595 RepID=UPI002234190D|nr:hypothetical protein LH935_21560 [Gordonia polyisoprenivorans]
MDSKKMFVSFIPWVLFSVLINRRGADAAAVAALLAAAVSLVLLIKSMQETGVKVLDVTGVATFGAFAVVGFSGGSPATNWIADYGRGSATLVLAAIMLGSVFTVPFTEQYARESVPREYWTSPVFRSVNRKISAMWAGVVAVMGVGHLLAGLLDPATQPVPGFRPVDLILNWVLPIGLILFAVRQTRELSTHAGGRTAPVTPERR